MRGGAAAMIDHEELDRRYSRPNGRMITVVRPIAAETGAAANDSGGAAAVALKHGVRTTMNEHEYVWIVLKKVRILQRAGQP